MAAEEVEEELDAVMAVYGSECKVIQQSPPHLLISLKPRTADDISQQFVEAVLVIKASVQYPSVPPTLELMETKGLDERKLSDLLSSLQVLAQELTLNPMLVAICEAATDRITEMNEPDGNCCFCMFPLVMEGDFSIPKPFMKLLSCFHCFHSDCFGRWWKWVLQERSVQLTDLCNGNKDSSTSSLISHYELLKKVVEEAQLKCPVCRKPINADDLLPIWDFLTADSDDQDRENENMVQPDYIFSKQEVARKAEFDEHFKAQQLCGGIIEPKKLEAIVPGMFITPPNRVFSASSSEPREGAGILSNNQSTSVISDPAMEATEVELLDKTSVTSDPTMEAREAELLDKTDKMELVQQGTHQANTSSSRKSINSLRHDGQFQRKGRQTKHAGAKKGQWVRRDVDNRK